MKGLAEAAGLGDAVVVNSCAVTAEAVRQARQQIRRLRREQPGREADRHRLRRPDRARGLRRDARGRRRPRQRREAPPRGLGAASPAAARASPSATSWPRPATPAPLIDGLGTRARAYVQVQNGCDHRCTFCIIPYGRGNSRSVPVGDRGRADRPPDGARLQRGRADRRRPDELGRRPRRHAAARRPRRRDPPPACPTCRASASPRSTRSRPTRSSSRRSAASRG